MALDGDVSLRMSMMISITTPLKHSSAPPLPSGANRTMRYRLTRSLRTSTRERLTH